MNFQRFLVFLTLLTSTSWAAESIAIVTGKIKGAKPWDPDSVYSGITGSEEAVIYVSKELAKLGYRVLVFADCPPYSRHSLPSSNPRFVDFNFNDGTLFDVAISWRMPKIAKLLKTRAKKIFFWPHDLCSEQVPHQEIETFDDVLWLSESQREQWISINPSFSKFTQVFGNGIDPSQFGEVLDRKNPYSCIYGSSYDRGLEVLLDIWPTVKKEYPKATLDLYYGWDSLIYGRYPPTEIAKLKSAVTSLAFLDVQEHGLVSHKELNNAYEKASFWTYPCTLLPVETFCITALKAQFAGSVPVIITGSALKETVLHGYQCNERENYLQTLLTAFKNAENISIQERLKQRDFILEKYTWDKIAMRWSSLFSAHALKN